MKLCGVCNKPIEKEWPHRHDYHEYDCPNFVDFVANPDAGSPNYPCDCDLVAHPECCPQCNKSRPTTVALDVCPECGGEELYSLRGDPVICWKCDGTGKRQIRV